MIFAEVSIVAIIGRPNVGKSTFFNRLIGEQKAITHDLSGVTRDRHYGKAHWVGKTFTVIDTGGYVTGSEDVFEAAIREQVQIAMEEADILLFLVDVREGLNPLDRDFAQIVRRSKKPVFLVANKADTFDIESEAFEFYELGLGDPIPISAANGQGTGELLDKVVEALPEPDVQDMPDIPKYAIVGRPNVGKSSLVNTLIGNTANIVTPIAGTTRDPIHTRYSEFGQDIMLVDTAGLRKKAKVHENIEFYSTVRTMRAVEECDVALLMIDATEGIQQQDLNILGTIVAQQKGLVILVNKWDLVKKETETAKEYEDKINEKIAPLSGVPIHFISAITKQRVIKALETALAVYHEKKKVIPTAKLNEVMLAAVQAHHPPSHRGRFIRIKYVTQVKAVIPTFLFFCNHPKHIKENYKRYLENKLRENFGFQGVPINVFFREK